MNTMMNRLSGAALLLVLITGTAWGATDSGTINFTGSITASSCTVGSPTAVALPTIPKSLLQAQNSNAGRTRFTISLSACTLATVTKVGLSFKNTANIDQTSGYLKNHAGTAPGVQIRLLNDAWLPINFVTNANSTAVAPSAVDGSGTATLTYYAEYFAPSAATVNSGTVSATIDFDLFYE